VEKNKILYIISTIGTGRGGHYHSLNHVSCKLGEAYNVEIISIGPELSPVISKNLYFKKHFYFKLGQLVREINKINYYIKKTNPDIIHFFDKHSYNFLRVFLIEGSHKVILTKCGGANDESYPYADNIIAFNNENKDFFKSKNKFRDSFIEVIPNRVNDLKEMPYEKQKIKKDNHFNFVRITRITNQYKKSIMNSIKLIKELNNVIDVPVRLYIIGVIQDRPLYNEIIRLKKLYKIQLEVLTTEYYTIEASNFLYLADAVIGTGRGLMEAASLGKVLLTIGSNSKYPILVNKETYDNAFHTNFSERNKFENTLTNLDNIKKMLLNRKYYEELSSFSFEKYLSDFSLNNGLQKYINFYNESIIGNGHKKDKMKIVKPYLKLIKNEYKNK